MKARLGLLIGTVALIASANGAPAAEATGLKDQVKVRVENAELHPGMEPGMYVCPAGHLHIKAMVENTASVPLSGIAVAGKAFDANGTLLGTATASPKTARLGPNEKAEVNLEFLTVTGPKIEQVKRHEETVTEARLAK